MTSCRLLSHRTLRLSLIAAGLLFVAGTQDALAETGALPVPATVACATPDTDTAFVPVDSWMYPALLRLYSMGYLHTAYITERPWTRSNIAHMLTEVAAVLDDARNYENSTNDEAQKIFDALAKELDYSPAGNCLLKQDNLHLESAYSVTRGLTGTPLRDSFHLGSTIINDYGRPYESGVNNYTGFSGTATAGRFLLYLRGEFQAAPSASGYSDSLALTLSNIDQIPANPATGLPYNQTTIPLGPIGTTTQGRLLEAYISTHVGNHEISFGKQDKWLSPAQGGSMAYSNNAENIYAFHINRTEPLNIPLLSRLTGPFRYEFMVGPLQGHAYIPNPAYEANPSPNLPNVISPGNPWVHVEQFSFKPTRDLEFSFERTVIWGGKGHEPITLRTFLRSFLSTNSTYYLTKYGKKDPGARFSAFDFSYRLPYLQNWLTLYSDMEAHDAPSPLAKPLHGTFREGLYLSHFPHAPKLDLRFEGLDTDSSVPSTPAYLGSIGGRYQYWEGLQPEGYTNQGQLFGDWVGREDKGGQAWLTYHLSGNEWLQVNARHQKASKDFIPGGTTLNDFGVEAVKRIGKEFELKGSFTYELWKAPVYQTGSQNVTTTSICITWIPQNKK